jgi:hypothetical protein
VNPPTGRRKHASKRCVVYMGKKEWKDTKYRSDECNVLLCLAPCFQIHIIIRPITEEMEV